MFLFRSEIHLLSVYIFYEMFQNVIMELILQSRRHFMMILHLQLFLQREVWNIYIIIKIFFKLWVNYWWKFFITDQALHGLWNYEVVEIFFLASKNEDMYLELEFGPHGHHLGLLLHGERNTLTHSFPIQYKAEISKKVFLPFAAFIICIYIQYLDISLVHCLCMKQALLLVRWGLFSNPLGTN